MQLQELGNRICILGPSNSGKSTLANAIARKCALHPIHLDQLFHLPQTDWIPRPIDEFVALHDRAIMGDNWVMDGNYSVCVPQRLLRATGVILLDISTPLSLFRYVRRVLLGKERVGGLEGGKDSIKWNIIHHIAIVTRANRQRYAVLYEQLHLPKIRLRSARAIQRCYMEWGLER
ncbi:MAG: AAA family ATPase [Dyella sp.]|uniref:AAA family ATPase n=1 Tax=Dyella sp. TaxID=1869338 RepID=UPI003F7E275E